MHRNGPLLLSGVVGLALTVLVATFVLQPGTYPLVVAIFFLLGMGTLVAIVLVAIVFRSRFDSFPNHGTAAEEKHDPMLPK
jgi:F0F1-type ATP synthase assembly protein I